MARETGRSAEDLYRDDPALPDPVTSVDRGRRGFLGGSGLAAVGAIIGGAMPFSQSGIPGAHAQGAAAPAAPKGPQHLKFPGKNEGLVVLGERP